MEQEIRIIRRLFIYGLISWTIVLLANLNSEIMFVSLKCPFVSNDLVMTLAGGISTGITAVLLEKMFKYRLDKMNIVKSMYYDAVLLYAEIYYWICNIKELYSHRELDIPENLFANKLQMINYYMERLRAYDYSSFEKKDSVKRAHDIFKEKYFYRFNKVFSDMTFFKIAICESKIDTVQNGSLNKEKIYKVLAIIENELQICEEEIEKLISVFAEADSNLDWDKDKDAILNGYLGVYSESLEEFISGHMEGRD